MSRLPKVTQSALRIAALLADGDDKEAGNLLAELYRNNDLVAIRDIPKAIEGIKKPIGNKAREDLELEVAMVEFCLEYPPKRLQQFSGYTKGQLVEAELSGQQIFESKPINFEEWLWQNRTKLASRLNRGGQELRKRIERLDTFSAIFKVSIRTD